jgi:hypothetical protein
MVAPSSTQHSHAYAAVGSPQQSVDYQTPGFVTAKDEILKIQGSVGGVDHLYPGHQSVDPGGDDAKCGTPSMLVCRARKLSAEPSVFRMSEGRRRRLGKICAGPEGCAAPETHQYQDD